MTVQIPWVPRLVLAGRDIRLPVQSPRRELEVDTAGFRLLDQRYSEPDAAFFYYLTTPSAAGDYELTFSADGATAHAPIQVRTLEQLRQPFDYNGITWPRRWPLGQSWETTKTGQTLQDLPLTASVDENAVAWWTTQDDATLWSQLPAAELPQAHYVNVHHGCPRCGTAIFSHHGFYPWIRQTLPSRVEATCPSCNAVFPSNDPGAGDFTGGDFADDGFGYFDADGHIYLFAAVHHRDQVSTFGTAIGRLTDHLRRGEDRSVSRQLGLLLLRYAVEIAYVAATPQFRYGLSKEEEEPWDWGQEDWAAKSDPIAALYRKGMLCYSIDVPIVTQTLALAYDTTWPLLREDRELVERANALGLEVYDPQEVVQLIEEMLSCLMMCCMDGGGLSNLPRTSLGVLTALRTLQRPDAQEVMTWLYDRGPAKLRVFTTNNFFPDGTPPESTGGYNNGHVSGLFDLEYNLRQLRQACPGAYPESEFPSLMGDPRAARTILTPHETVMLGKAGFGFGDGTSSGVQGGDLGENPRFQPLAFELLPRAADFTFDPALNQLVRELEADQSRALGTTVHDGVGIAILRTGETPERAAAGIVYGDTTGHRHMDLLDVQLFAFNHPFLTDLGYPQSWASVTHWEGNWATHNAVWGVVPHLEPLQLPSDTPWFFLKQIAGRGRLVRTLLLDGMQVMEIEAERWCWDMERLRWYRPGVSFRRLLALVETDGDGVALIDLARVTGGNEHWRVCRGLEGTFAMDGVDCRPRPGTAVDPTGERCRLDNLTHPDYVGLACMDQVEEAAPTPSWTGRWESCHNDDVRLDLHQVGSSPSTRVSTARATAVMGTPEESRYAYRTVLWRRAPDGPDDVTRVDLVFEPRLGQPTVSSATEIPIEKGGPSAAGVHLTTRGGRQLDLYWAPDGDGDETALFADGVELEGRLALLRDGELAAVGTSGVRLPDRHHRFPNALQTGTVIELDRGARTLVVEGLAEVGAGDRVRLNPLGRGHNYQVVRAEELAPGRHRLQLDVTSLLGRARVVHVDVHRVELEFNITARTGNLHNTRLEREMDGGWAVIAEAMNPDADRTEVRLREPLSLKPGQWVAVVDYVVGDALAFEPVRREQAG